MKLGPCYFTPISHKSHSFIGSVEKTRGQWLYFIVDLWMEWKTKNTKNSLGAMWNASHLAEGLCALRHWKRVSMPQTTHSLRHPLTRAIHIAPRKKTTRRFTAKNQFLGTAYNYNKTLNTIYMVQKKRIFARFYHAWCTGVSFYLSYLIIRFLKIGFSPKASGYYPFGDATDLVRGRRWWCGVADSSLCLKSDMRHH